MLATVARADVAIVYPAMRYQVGAKGKDMRKHMGVFLREVLERRKSKSGALPDLLMFEEPLAQHFRNGPFSGGGDVTHKARCDINGQPSNKDRRCCALANKNPYNFRKEALNDAIAAHEAYVC